LEDGPQHLDRRADPIPPARQATEPGQVVLDEPGEQVLDGGAQQIGLGVEVRENGALRDARSLRHVDSRQPGIALLHQHRDGRIQQAAACLLAPLLLSAAGT
jgi:hypothetical protein